MKAWCGCDVCDLESPNQPNATHPCSPTAPDGVRYARGAIDADKWVHHAPNSNGSAATKPVLWCMNSEYYANMQWEVNEVDAAKRELHFGRGGFQAGQKSYECTAWYVENVKEELDHAGEFYYDNVTGLLSYVVNNTAELNAKFVAPQLPSLVRLLGTADEPVTGISLRGLKFAHTAATYLQPYSTALGGGDYAIHRNAALYVEGAEHFVVEESVFDHLDGNAVLLYKYNRDTVIVRGCLLYV